MAEYAVQIWDKLVSKNQKETLEWKILGFLSTIVRIATQKSFSHRDVAHRWRAEPAAEPGRAPRIDAAAEPAAEPGRAPRIDAV